MKIIFNKYGGIKTIEDRQLLVQSSDNANYVDIYYQDDAGNFADETVNLATIAFKRSDTFEISERTCDAVREELTNKILYFRYVFLEDELAINGELQMTVRLKQVVFDPEDDSKVLLIKQRAMGKITAHIYEAIGGNYENFDVVDGRILQLELWQANFESDYYNADQIDAKLVLERQAANDSLDDHNASNEAHEDIRQAIENTDNGLQEQIDTINGTLSEQDFRINELEDFANNLETDIAEEIENAVADKADLVDGKVPREQMDDYFDDIIEGFYINHQFYSEGEENEDYLITPELGKLYIDVDTNVLYRWIGSQYEKVTGTFELTKAKIEEKLTGDITSHNHATEISNHNTSETAHTGIRNAVAEAKAIAEGKARAIVFATEANLDGWLATPPTFSRPDGKTKADLKIGDNLYIIEVDKPDYWWDGTSKKILETQKVDLTEYAKTTELLTLGTTSNDAYRGDLGQIAYQHSQASHAPSNAQKNVQSDWNQTTNTEDDYIKNKPPIPTIPDLELNDNAETDGKYISKIEVDGTNKHKLNITKQDLPTGFSGSYNDLTDTPSTFPPTEHNHNTLYYKKSETYTKTQTDALVGNLQGQTQELKSITTQPSGTFVYGDLYYNSSTKGMYYWNGSSWELTGVGEPIAGVIYSFNGILYFWDESTLNLIQIGGGVDLSNYYTKTEVDNAINSAILGLLGGES